MLDPQRIGLNAASVGFLKRTGQNVDWGSFNQALQTDDSRVAEVRAQMETPVDELHVMGGQRFGLEGNTNLKTYARQQRQMNAYPLRSFSADAPSIILPDKYGGLPLYNRNQTEYKDFVSSYTAPLSMALQNDTILLGKQGYSVTNESASQPFKDVGFEHNLHKSRSAIDYNEALMRQKKWLELQSRQAKKRKGQFAVNRESRGMGDGIFIGSNGVPMTTVDDEMREERFTDVTLDRPMSKADVASQVRGQYGAENLPGTNQPSASTDAYQTLNSGRASERIGREVMSVGSLRGNRKGIAYDLDFDSGGRGGRFPRGVMERRYARDMANSVSSIRPDMFSSPYSFDDSSFSFFGARAGLDTTEGFASSTTTRSATQNLPDVNPQDANIDSFQRLNPLYSQKAATGTPSLVNGSQAGQLGREVTPEQNKQLADLARARRARSVGGLPLSPLPVVENYLTGRTPGLTPFKNRTMTMQELRDSGVNPGRLSSATIRSMERRAKKLDKVQRQLFVGMNRYPKR
jgi:hypothetical protein